MKKKKWNDKIEGCAVGGWFGVSNSSQGYHGLEQQWWEYYAKQWRRPKVLLVSEGIVVKSEFNKIYPDWRITTTDRVGGENSDFTLDICESRIVKQFNLIICQATMEHLYDPFGAIGNMVSMLSTGGVMIIHTHPPGFPRHDWPHDYFRFMDDWWKELPNQFDIELLEFFNLNNYHVFACYKKIRRIR